jgi:hypothetical protein
MDKFLEDTFGLSVDKEATQIYASYQQSRDIYRRTLEVMGASSPTKIATATTDMIEFSNVPSPTTTIFNHK